jgi:hypothetical protein
MEYHSSPLMFSGVRWTVFIITQRIFEQKYKASQRSPFGSISTNAKPSGEHNNVSVHFRLGFVCLGLAGVSALSGIHHDYGL